MHNQHYSLCQKVLNNMVYKATNDFLMDFKKKLGRNFNLESINIRKQKDIVRDVSTSNNRKSKKHLSFQKSDSTFSINSIAVIPKEVKIKELQLKKWDPKSGILQIKISCSTGTYIRSIARDLG